MQKDKQNLTVIGIGRLGLCTALCFESKGYNVVGVDVSENYVESLNNKTFRSKEPFVNSYLDSSVNFHATTNLEKGLIHSDLIFIVVPTPTQKNSKGYDHSMLINLLNDINELRVKDKHIIICSTVMPGFSKIAKVLIKNCENTFLCYNPEFIAQGSIMYDFLNAPMILIGEESKTTGDYLQKLYETICTNTNSKICRMSIESAEITKIGLNCFITTKIAFANMIGDIADKTENANKNDILKAIGSDPRVGNKCLKAGFGFGGPCFPRDNRALEQYANSIGVLPLIPFATDESNKFHTELQFQNYDKEKDPIVFENIGYKNPCPVPIIEESQKLIIADKLASNGHKIIIIDHDYLLDEVKKTYKNKFIYVSKDKAIHQIYIYFDSAEKTFDMKERIKDNKLENLAPITWVDFYNDEKTENMETDKEHRTYILEHACYKRIIRDIATNEIVLIGMVMKNGFIFNANYVKQVEHILKTIPSNWDMIILNSFYEKDDDDKHKNLNFHINEIQHSDLTELPTCNYILRKETARKIMNSRYFNKNDLKIDFQLALIVREERLNVYQCKPYLTL